MTYQPDPGRRTFVRVLGLTAAAMLPGGRLWARPRGRDPGHPTPRPGITAANVLPDAELTEYPDCQSAFQAVWQIPEVVDGIRCQCGCAELPGFYSLLSCYESAGMARICVICQGEARLALRLHQGGKSLDEIRAAIDARYG